MLHTAYFVLGLLTGMFLTATVFLLAMERGKRSAH